MSLLCLKYVHVMSVYYVQKMSRLLIFVRDKKNCEMKKPRFIL